MPEIDRLNRLEQSIDELEKKIGKTTTYQESFNSLTPGIERLENLVEFQKLTLEGGGDIDHSLKRLTELTTALNLIVLFWRPGDSVVDSGLQMTKIPIQMALEGPFHQVVLFFNRLGQLDTPLQVEEFEIQGSQNQGSENGVSSIQARLTLVGYATATPTQMAKASALKHPSRMNPADS